MPDIQETRLAGVGVRHAFTTAAGERIAVLSHRTGRREIAVYDADDPDSCSTVLHLDEDDAYVLGELLGARPVSDAVAGVEQLEGVAIDWIKIAADSEGSGVTIREAAIGARTGASIVAVGRGTETLAAPGADLVLQPGDVVVAVGPPDGLKDLRALLAA